jgi:GT2 family glycosyltransferase
LPTGEDIDFGLRVRRKNWKFYFLPDASVKHMHRAGLKALLKVWKSYGVAHGPLVSQHAKNYLEIIFQFLGAWPNMPLIKFRFPIKGFIYIGNFHLIHLFGLLSLAGLVGFFVSLNIWWALASLISIILTSIFIFRFISACFRIEPYNKWLAFSKMKYLTNLYFILGGLKGITKHKAICIEPSF